MGPPFDVGAHLRAIQGACGFVAPVLGAVMLWCSGAVVEWFRGGPPPTYWCSLATPEAPRGHSGPAPQIGNAPRVRSGRAVGGAGAHWLPPARTGTSRAPPPPPPPPRPSQTRGVRTHKGGTSPPIRRAWRPWGQKGIPRGRAARTVRAWCLCDAIYIGSIAAGVGSVWKVSLAWRKKTVLGLRTCS